MPHNLYKYFLCQLDREKFWRSSGVGVKTGGWRGTGLWMFQTKHTQNRFPCLLSSIARLNDSALIPLCDPPHRHLYIPSDHQAMEPFFPVLLQIIPLDLERYWSHIRAVSLDRIWFRLASQASRRFLIRRRITWEAVTWGLHCRITVWKMMNHSAFHLHPHTHLSSSLSGHTPPPPPPGMSYRLYGITTISFHLVCHITLSTTPLLRCLPSLVCTQYS